MNQLITRAGLLDDFFRDVSPGFYVKPLQAESTAPQIKVDVSETDQAYFLKAELPGVCKDDIHVHVEGNLVALRAEIKPDGTATEGEKLLRRERFFGNVARSFQLPHEIDDSRARAKHDNGLLVLTLPKKLATPGHRLAVE